MSEVDHWFDQALDLWDVIDEAETLIRRRKTLGSVGEWRWSSLESRIAKMRDRWKPGSGPESPRKKRQTNSLTTV
jgi:hypothetical protein